MNDVRSVWREPCILGEGPIWHPVEKVLYWVDIVSKALHRLDIKTNHHHSWQMPTEIGCIAPTAGGGLIAGLRDGIALLQLQDNDVRYVTKLNESRVMINDGHCDRQGRFWIGTKDIAETDSNAKIYCLRQSTLVAQDKNYIVANGLISSLDAHYFFVSDSPRRQIYRYDFDAEKGVISGKKIFATIPEDAGYPDGMAIDSEGFLWSCHFNGWRVTRYSPKGDIDRVIKIPTQAPTSCCFGGDDLKTLFITSAKRDLSTEDLVQQPHAGHVFAMAVEVAGVSEPVYLQDAS